MMDDDFFSDDETFKTLGESELAALEENALNSTQPPQVQRLFSARVAGNRATTVPTQSGPTSYRTPCQQQPQKQQQQRDQWRPTAGSKSRQTNSTNFGPTTVPALRDVTLRDTPQNSQSGRGYNQIPPAEYNRYDETTELRDTTGPRVPHQEDAYYYQGQHQQARQGFAAQDDENYDGMEYDANDLDELLGAVNHGAEAALPMASGNDGQWGAMGYQHRHQRDTTREQELQAKIMELEEKLNYLHQAHQTAESKALAKAGEVAIVRNKIDKAGREHERQLQQLHTNQKEEREKLEQELRVAREEAEKLRTRIMFLSNDLEEIIRKNKALEKSATAGDDTDRGNGQASPMTTPKKKKPLPHRDGFDDDEIVMTSPKCKLKAMIPSKKRKRQLLESPIGSLPLSQSRRTPFVESSRHLHVIDEEILQRLWCDDHRFDLFEALATHRSVQGNIRTLEALSKYTLPSVPDTTLSSLFIDKITALKVTHPKAEFPAVVCRSLLSVWQGIMHDRFWEPFHFILDLLSFVVMWDPGNTCATMLNEAVELIQLTIDVNAMPRINRTTEKKLVSEIDTNKCLILLESIAFGTMAEETLLRRFWKLIRVDFPFILLNAAQPLQDIQRFVSMLCTSVFGDSFGPQLSNEAQQRQNESHILEGVTRLLVEVPDVGAEEPGSRHSQIVQLRKEVVHFLGCLVGTERGSKLIISHNSAFSRLVRRISDELDYVYDFKGDVRSSVELVNIAVRLLHGIIITHPGVPLGTKLSGGATHKHLVAMTRLAFSQRLLQEAGIEEDVREYAYSILEMSVTPQEGEALQELFNTPQAVSGR
ncbi:hypothetical protein EV426DRAFT_423425 [Tirmania nivea]|nr:hypothetical protein EV426DRAFT_423425 [Tirmania nivea]